MPNHCEHPSELPSWLAEPQNYQPRGDRDGFVSRSLLSVASVLAFFRLDGGQETRLSPSPALKLALVVLAIVLISLSRNFLFVLAMLAALLARAALLPAKELARVAAGAGTAAILTALVMTPALLLGQPQSALTLAGKALVCTGLTLVLALTTPQAQLTGALKRFGMPSIVIMTLDLTLRSIVRLGETAREVLSALSLRSVGRNRAKGQTMGGIGAVVLVKASVAARDTLDAMRCRGFTGSYETHVHREWRLVDLAWLGGAILMVVLFAHLQGAV